MTGGDYRGRRVLVTGGAGVIGRELLDLLCASGASVLCCDLKPSPPWLDSAVTYLEGDANELTAGQVAEFSRSIAFTSPRPLSAPPRARSSGLRTSTTTCYSAIAS